MGFTNRLPTAEPCKEDVDTRSDSCEQAAGKAETVRQQEKLDMSVRMDFQPQIAESSLSRAWSRLATLSCSEWTAVIVEWANAWQTHCRCEYY